MTTSCQNPHRPLISKKPRKRGRVTKRKFNASAEDRKDLYTRVTDKIIAQLEQGVRPWAQPWEGGKTGARPLRHNAIPYTGINVLMLWASAMERSIAASTSAGRSTRCMPRPPIRARVARRLADGE